MYTCGRQASCINPIFVSVVLLLLPRVSMHVSCRLEIVREKATGDRNMAGRVRERMRIMAEEAAMFDSDRFDIGRLGHGLLES